MIKDEGYEITISMNINNILSLDISKTTSSLINKLPPMVEIKNYEFSLTNLTDDILRDMKEAREYLNEKIK